MRVRIPVIQCLIGSPSAVNLPERDVLNWTYSIGVRHVLEYYHGSGGYQEAICKFQQQLTASAVAAQHVTKGPVIMPLLRFGGIGERHVVILHATGFLSAMYEPLAAVLAQQCVVWGLDFPGHGSAVDAKLPEGPSGSSSSSSSHCATCNTPGAGGSSTMSISQQGVTQYVIATIQQAGLQGCYAFGHSAGGAFALLAASRCPQLFTAIYCFEAVLAAPASHAFMAEASASGAITTDGQLLGSMARKRRAAFSSRGDALQHLTAKPPFSRMDPQVVALYVQHGLVEVEGSVVAGPGQQDGTVLCTGEYQQQQQRQQQGSSEQVQTCQLQQAPTQQGARQAAVHSLAQQQQQQVVRLLCRPEQEAAYFDALHPPPSLDPGSVSCPVLLAVAAPAQGGSSSTPAEALVTHEAVKAWFYKHSQGSRRQLHGALRVLNCELAAAMPTARLLELEGVSHFGPLEDPVVLADSCARFFNSCDLVQQQQQQQTSSKL